MQSRRALDRNMTSNCDTTRLRNLEQTGVIDWLQQTKKFIDKFHLRNHKREVCKTQYNANRNLSDEELKVNTNACEQLNKWANKWKSSVQKMGTTMLFYVLRMSHLHNLRINGRV